jgi:hypothetical protein
MQANDPPRRLGFGVFEVDLRDRQLTKRGLRVRLQEQPFQLLAMLLERPGEVVTRDELRNRLSLHSYIRWSFAFGLALVLRASSCVRRECIARSPPSSCDQ